MIYLLRILYDMFDIRVWSLVTRYSKDSLAYFSATLQANDPLPDVSWDIATVARTNFQLTGTQTSTFYAVKRTEQIYIDTKKDDVCFIPF